MTGQEDIFTKTARHPLVDPTSPSDQRTGLLMKPVPRRLTRHPQCLPDLLPAYPSRSQHVDHALERHSQMRISCGCVFHDQQKWFARDKLWISDFARYAVVVANLHAESDTFVADKCGWPSDELFNVELRFSAKRTPQLFCCRIGCTGLICDRCRHGDLPDEPSS